MAVNVPKTPNAAYKKRRSKRTRTLGPDALKGATTVVDNIAIDRERVGRKQYRWSDLKGSDRIEMLRMVRDCAMAAMTEFEMASYFGVSTFTLNEWCMKDPEFAIAMRLPKQLADERVEKALYHSALGYRFQSEEIKILDDGTVHRAPIVKQLPPNVTAASFWLKNRQGWKDKVDADINLNGTVEITDKSEDPRQLAMAVLDVLQQAIYDKLPVIIDDDQVGVVKAATPDYSSADLEQMSEAEIAALFEADPDEDR